MHLKTIHYQLQNLSPCQTLRLYDLLLNLNLSHSTPFGIALCQKVIDDAPIHAKQRLAGLLFQLNSRQILNYKNSMLSDSDYSSVTTAPLTLIQNMLKDLHAMQTESIYLSTRKYQEQLKPSSTAIIYSFKKTDSI